MPATDDVPQAIFRKLSGNPVGGALRVTTCTMPRRMLIMPSVVMKGLIFSRVTMAPLIQPMTGPRPGAASTARPHGDARFHGQAATSPQKRHRRADRHVERAADDDDGHADDHQAVGRGAFQDGQGRLDAEEAGIERAEHGDRPGGPTPGS